MQYSAYKYSFARIYGCQTLIINSFPQIQQCWTEGRSSTAVAEDLRPTATATVAEV